MQFEEIFRRQVKRYPVMQIQDLYKLIHQSAMGSEHAIAKPAVAREWLLREISALDSGPAEPIIDPISVDGQMVRVHLRPFLIQGGNIESLFDAFIQTANQYKGETSTLENHWKAASRLMHFPIEEMDSFFRTQKAENFPAIHHSTTFSQNYHPAYRVVWKPFLT